MYIVLEKAKAVYSSNSSAIVPYFNVCNTLLYCLQNTCLIEFNRVTEKLKHCTWTELVLFLSNINASCVY